MLVRFLFGSLVVSCLLPSLLETSHLLIRDLFKLVEMGQSIGEVISAQPPKNVLPTVVEEPGDPDPDADDIGAVDDAEFDPSFKPSAPPASESGDTTSTITLRSRDELPADRPRPYLNTLQAGQEFLARAFHGRADI